MEVFTPSADTFHDTAELPEDLVDLRSAATLRVGVEAALDNTAFLAAFGTRIRNLTYEVPEDTTGAVLNVASGTSTDWQLITDCTKVVATMPNDRVVVLVQCDTDLGNAGTHYIDIAHAQASAAEAEFAGSLRLLEGTERKGHTLIGVWQATNDEDVTVKLRGKAESGDFSVYGGIVMIVAVIANKGIWP